jgi:hypothetical protein
LFLHNDLCTFRIREWGNPKKYREQRCPAMSRRAAAKSKFVDSLGCDDLFAVIQQLNEVHTAG